MDEEQWSALLRKIWPLCAILALLAVGMGFLLALPERYAPREWWTSILTLGVCMAFFALVLAQVWWNSRWCRALQWVFGALTLVGFGFYLAASEKWLRTVGMFVAISAVGIGSALWRGRKQE